MCCDGSWCAATDSWRAGTDPGALAIDDDDGAREFFVDLSGCFILLRYVGHGLPAERRVARKLAEVKEVYTQGYALGHAYAPEITVLRRAMAEDRNERYGSAAELRLDLERFRRNEPLSAMPATACRSASSANTPAGVKRTLTRRRAAGTPGTSAPSNTTRTSVP